MNRTFLLPLLSVTSLAATACSASIDGNWDLRQSTYSGDTYSWPISETDTYDGITYTYTNAISMSLDKDGSGSLSQTYTYTYSDQPTETETYTYTGTWEKADGGSFDITFSEFELDLNCTLEDDELECNDDDGLNLIFAPADE